MALKEKSEDPQVIRLLILGTMSVQNFLAVHPTVVEIASTAKKCFLAAETEVMLRVQFKGTVALQVARKCSPVHPRPETSSTCLVFTRGAILCLSFMGVPFPLFTTQKIYETLLQTKFIASRL